MLFVHQDAGLGTTPYIRRAEPEMVREYGLKVWLCQRCHRDPRQGVHFNRDVMKIMHRTGQQAFEKEHSRDEFMNIFGKNYL